MKKIIVLLLVSLALVGCGSKSSDELEEIVIGGTSLPHADFLNQLEDPLKEQGYKLVVKEFDDYVLPNTALENGDLDANYFQHIPYLEDFNESHGTNLVPILKVHYEPIAIYGGLKDSLDEVATGDKVIVPDDATNLPRALKLLEDLGWITLSGDRDTADIKQVDENIKGIDIELASAENVAKLLDNAEYGIINSNFALVAGVTDKGIQAEEISADVIANIVNVVAIRAGEEDTDKTKAILKAFEDEAVVDYIKNEFAPAAISVLGE